MSHGGYHGTVISGSGKDKVIIQQGSSKDSKGHHTGGGVYKAEGWGSKKDTGKKGDTSQVMKKEIKKKTKKKEKESTTIMQKIYGGGQGGDPTLTKKEWAKTAPKAEHKLASQFDYLTAKYGPNFKNTSQGQALLGYLKDVPYTKGGGMGAPDPTYGTGTYETGQDEDYRQELIQAMKEAEGKQAEDILKKSQADAEYYRGKLTSDQYFNYRQQLHQANPAAYESVFPISSGKGVAALMSPTTSMVKDIAKSVFGTKKQAEKKPVYEGQGMDPSLFWNPAGTKYSDGGITEADSGNLLPANFYDDMGVAQGMDPIYMGYGPGDQAYTAVMPEEGYQYVYDAQGHRYSIPIGSQSGFVESPTGDRVSLPWEWLEGERWQAPPGNKDLLDTSQIPFVQNAFFKPDQSYYFGGGNYGLTNLLNPNQQLISLAGGGMVPGYAGGGMVPGYRGGGIMGIDTSKPDYSAFGKFILGNLPQGGIGNMARGIV